MKILLWIKRKTDSYFYKKIKAEFISEVKNGLGIDIDIYNDGRKTIHYDLPKSVYEQYEDEFIMLEAKLNAKYYFTGYTIE